MTGLVYRALPMGAVPIAHDSIIELSSIKYEEVEFGDGTGYHFLPSEGTFISLTEEDRGVLDEVLNKFGKMTKDEIVQKMHSEAAYSKTSPGSVIPFRYALELSLV